MTLAQEEADKLFSQKERVTAHPEDRQSDSDSEPQAQGNRSRNITDSKDKDSSDDDFGLDDDIDSLDDDKMLAKQSYRVNNTTFNANTGPKGVIADALEFEKAKKKSFRRTLLDATSFDFRSAAARYGKSANTTSNTAPAPAPVASNNLRSGRSPDEDDAAENIGDEEFMRRWRARRMKELENGDSKRGPAKRRYGLVDNVDAAGYLDALEKAASDTVVIVCIFDPEMNESCIVVDCLPTLARAYPATRFVKLHHDIADMDHVTAPALIAYRAGDVVATIVNIAKQLPDGRACSYKSLEDLLMLYKLL